MDIGILDLVASSHQMEEEPVSFLQLSEKEGGGGGGSVNAPLNQDFLPT